MSVDHLLHISFFMNDIIQVFKFLKSMLMLTFQYDECLIMYFQVISLCWKVGSSNSGLTGMLEVGRRFEIDRTPFSVNVSKLFNLQYLFFNHFAGCKRLQRE